jgi:phosphate transport system protein
MTNNTCKGHTFKLYDEELNHLHELVMEMGELVLSQVRAALAALLGRDAEQARRVIAADALVDRMEERADAEIVKLLARRSPVAADLRMVMAISKSVSDLERIGDEAARIAGVAIQLFAGGGRDAGLPLRGVSRLGELVARTLQCALGVFKAWDEESAREVAAAHEEMDARFQDDLRLLMSYVLEDLRRFGFAISMALVINALERIGHHAHNLVTNVVLQVARVENGDPGDPETEATGAGD